ncbi:MAG: hypothetical protein HFJ50_10125 [Clostridia bacterium]|jgi:peptidoglycan hydrolase CwlO-like protein|nr:hypothetical protein [Clostridia bacterium]
MKDEQFEILVGLIGEVKESLEGQISSQISTLRGEMNEKFAEMKKSQNEMEIRLSKAIYDVSEQLEEYERIYKDREKLSKAYSD